MDMKVSTDPKIVKMFRRLERFLDQEGLAGGAAIDFINAETWRKFATFIAPEVLDDLLAQLDAANETIAMLEDESTLLALIDAQNDVLMGRLASAVEEAVDFPPDEKCGTFHVDGLNYAEADADVPGVIVSAQEYDELVNLRVKRARDKETITGLNATVRENKRGAETLSRQRDSYLAQLLEAKQALRDAQEWAFIGGIRGVGFPDLEEFHAFTSDTIRD